MNDLYAQQMRQLGEYTRAKAVYKADQGRSELILECQRAIRNLLAASTATTDLVVDVDALSVALADAILASPKGAKQMGAFDTCDQMQQDTLVRLKQMDRRLAALHVARVEVALEVARRTYADADARLTNEGADDARTD